jgi:cyclophilin family peptidyl-prolyl cis-trans isomerase
MLRVLLFLLSWVLAAIALAEGAETPAEKFDKLYKRYQANSEFVIETNAIRKELGKQAQSVEDEAEREMPDMRAIVEAAYAAEPNKDPLVAKMLAHTTRFAFDRDDFEPMLRSSLLLLKHGSQFSWVNAAIGKAAAHLNDCDLAEKHLKLAIEGGDFDGECRTLLADLPQQRKLWAAEQAIREKEFQADDLPRVRLETTKGIITVELFENEAPQTVGNFIHLVESKFYDGLKFHRVKEHMVAQSGDPDGDGTGGPGYSIYSECYKPNYRAMFRGSICMAASARDTGGSQFFFMLVYSPQLNGENACFGRVIEGFDVLALLHRVDPTKIQVEEPDKILKADVIRKRDHVYAPTKVPAQ